MSIERYQKLLFFITILFAGIILLLIGLLVLKSRSQKKTGDILPNAASTKREEVKKSGQTTPFIYTIQQNDTLFDLGIRFCHDDHAYLLLMEKNNITHENEVIYPGNKITIACQ